MLWFAASRKTLDRDLRMLVKQGKTAKIKSLLLSNPSDLIDSTIFHMAAKYSNVDLIDFLLGSGYDVNVRDSRGTTPLLTASLHNNVEVVKRLLEANADVFARNMAGQTPLQLLVDGAPSSVTRLLLKRLKSIRSSPEDMSRMLLDADCSLEFALLLENAEVTRSMLNHTEEISVARAHDLLLIAMDSEYLENINVLLHNGHKAPYRREKFLENIAERLRGSPSELESARPFLQQLASWDVIDETFVQTLEKLFETADKRVLKLLLQCDIEALVRRKFGSDLLVHLFVNRNVSVIELLKGKKFEVDERDRNGQTALHVAARHIFPERIEFLLSRGANANVKDKCGRTALHFAWEVKCIEPLLRGGADVQVIDHSGLSVFDRTKSLTESMEVMLAHLAVVEGRGVMVKKKICERICSRIEFKEFYDECRRQVEWMKGWMVSDSMSMFEVMVKKTGELDEGVVEKALGSARDYKVHEFYVSTLEINLKRSVGVNDRGFVAD